MALSKILDVSNPSESGSALSPLIPGAGNGVVNSVRFQLMVDEVCRNNPTDAKAIFFPINYWAFANTVTFPNNISSWRVFSLGGVCKSLSQMNAHSQSCTYLVWEGNTAGPMFRIQNTDGDIWHGLNFDGDHGPNLASGTLGLDVLIKYERNGGGTGSIAHHWHDFSIMNAQRLFWAADDSQSIGTAEFLFDGINVWNCGETSSHAFTSEAFFSDNPQSVNNVWEGKPIFNNCGYCVSVEDTGRVTIRNGTFAIVGTVLKRNGGSQNVSGDLIECPHLDGGSASEGRKQLYKSTNASSTVGDVKIIIPKYGSVGSVTDEFAVISSFSGTVLTLANAVRMRAGDYVAFVRKDDRSNVNGGKVETTILARISDTLYTTTVAAGSLGFTLGGGETIENAYDCCNGEALIECVSSDDVHVDGAFLSFSHIRAGRLARLTHSSFSTGRSPSIVLSRTKGYSTSEFDEAGLSRLITKSGTCYWRFEDAKQIADGAAPLTVGNFGVVSSGSSGDTVVVNQSSEVLMRKYATSETIRFTLRDPATGALKPGATFEVGDSKVGIDDTAPANTDNLPTEIGGGEYKIVLTAAELTGKNVRLLVQDQTVPAVFSSREVGIDTMGHEDAQHAVDIDQTNIRADLRTSKGSATAVDRFDRAAGSMILGTVGTGSSVGTIVTSSLSPDPAILDGLKYRVLIFAPNTTTAALRGVARDVTGSTAGGVLTVSPSLPATPVSGDTFVVS